MSLRKTSALSLWVPVVACLFLIYFLSSRTADQLYYSTPDFVAHGLEYAVLGLFLIRALNGGMARKLRWRVVLGTLGLSLAWAVGDELHQMVVPTRIASVGDVIADMTGSALACVTFAVVVHWRARLMGVRQEGTQARDTESSAELVLLTRRDCPLCHDASEVLSRVVPEYDVSLVVQDVDSKQELASLYGEEVPVLLVNGKKASKFRLDERQLRRRLKRWKRGNGR